MTRDREWVVRVLPFARRDEVEGAEREEAARSSLVHGKGDRSLVMRVHARAIAVAMAAPLVLELAKYSLRSPSWRWATALGAAVAGVFATHRFARGCASLALVAVALVALTFPTTPNHVFALAVALGICGVASSGIREGARFLTLLRWLAVSILFWSGAQKLLYGTYWDGQFLAAKLASGEARWTWLSLAVRQDELSRLRALGPEGPFRVESPMFLVMSRAVPLIEVGLGLALVAPRVRPWAAVAAAGVVVALQAFAGEMVFAITALALLTTYASVRTTVHIARVLWCWAAVAAFVFWRWPGSWN